jgi:site-specific recombinase XerD
MSALKYKLELKNPKEKSPLNMRFTWGQKTILPSGKPKYGSIKISTSHSIDPISLGKDNELKYLSGDKRTEIERSIYEIQMDMRQAFSNMKAKFQNNNLITPELLRTEFENVSGRASRQFNLPTNIELSLPEIAKRKGLSKARIIAYGSALNHLKTWAKEENVKLDWLTFTSKNYHDFMYYLKAQGKAPNTLAGYRNRINSWINAAKEAKLPIQVDSMPSKYFAEKPKSKVILSDEQLMEIANYSCQSRNKQTIASRREVKKILMILLATGCRISDLYKITNPDNHKTDEKGNLYVDFVASKKTGNQNQTRIVVPIMQNIEDIVSVIPPKSISQDKIRKGIRSLLRDLFGEDTIVTINDQVLNVVNDFTPHCARATCNTFLMRQNVIPLHLIQQMLGHKQYFGAGATEYYYQQDKFEEAKALREFLSRIPFYTEGVVY